jgi:hypothetical protein
LTAVMISSSSASNLSSCITSPKEKRKEDE